MLDSTPDSSEISEPWPDCRKFLMHFSTKNDGKTIEVKPKRQRMA